MGLVKVYAVHNIARRSISVYVENGEWEGGVGLFLTPTGVVEVAPGAEAPAYATIPVHLAERIAAAIRDPGLEPPFAAGVSVETWGDFAELVERVMGAD